MDTYLTGKVTGDLGRLKVTGLLHLHLSIVLRLYGLLTAGGIANRTDLTLLRCGPSE